jgi:hypothetical protein
VRLREGVCAVQNKLAAVIVEAELLRETCHDPAGAERLVTAAWEASRLLTALSVRAGGR